MSLNSRAFSHIGGRAENQDAVRAEVNGDSGLFVVADGLGGHRNGKAAAEATIQAMFSDWEAAGPMDADRLRGLVERANSDILQVQKEQFCSCKSTVVALAVEGQRAFWAHTGDSRLYGFRDGKLWPLTEDHSVAYLKYKTGEITREQIPTDEDQNALLRALGGYTWEPVVGSADDLRPGDAFLLCSDGFWELVSEAEMLEDRAESPTADAWAEKMLRRAAQVMEQRSGCDNLSVITVMLN